MNVMDLHRHGAALCLCRRKPLDVDFERQKELIDEKAIADALLHSIKEKVFRKVRAVWSVYQKWTVYQCE
jgi:hypothetical protein